MPHVSTCHVSTNTWAPSSAIQGGGSTVASCAIPCANPPNEWQWQWQRHRQVEARGTDPHFRRVQVGRIVGPRQRYVLRHRQCLQRRGVDRQHHRAVTTATAPRRDPVSCTTNGTIDVQRTSAYTAAGQGKGQVGRTHDRDPVQLRDQWQDTADTAPHLQTRT